MEVRQQLEFGSRRRAEFKPVVAIRFRICPGRSGPERFWRVCVGEKLREQFHSAQCGSHAWYVTNITSVLCDARVDIVAPCLFVHFCTLGRSQFQSSAPVNIPGSFGTSAPFSSPSPSPPVRPHTAPFFSSHLSQHSQSESAFLGPAHSSLGLSTSIRDPIALKKYLVRLTFFFPSNIGLNGMSSNIWEHFPSGQGSPGTPPTLLPSGPCPETTRLRQELEDAHRTLKQWSHSWRHTAQVSQWLVELSVCTKRELTPVSLFTVPHSRGQRSKPMQRSLGATRRGWPRRPREHGKLRRRRRDTPRSCRRRWRA